MNDYTYDVDERRRVHAMEEAIRNASVGTDAKHLVNDAKVIEAYLAGPKGPTSVVLDPKVKAA